jgi:hypothetical protein
MRKDYNKSGTGVFSKEEVVVVIKDLREESRQQEELKTTHIDKAKMSPLIYLENRNTQHRQDNNDHAV